MPKPCLLSYFNLMLLAGAAVAGTATPITSPAPSSYLSQGIYVGGAIGYDYAQSKHNFDDVFIVSHGISTFEGQYKSAGSGFAGGVFIGYGKMWTERLYLGAEAFIYGNTTKLNTIAFYDHFHEEHIDRGGISDSLSIKNNFGVSILPGIKINPSTLAYFRVSYTQVAISGNESSILYDKGSGIPETITPFAFPSTHRGYNYGVGLESAITSHLSLRGDVVHANYGRFTTGLGNSFNFSDNQALASLIYHFS